LDLISILLAKIICELLFRKLYSITIMTEMSKKEIEKFLMHDTFTAKLATVNNNGSPHEVPIWFLLDGRKDQARKRIGDIIFAIYDSSLEALNIQHNNRVSICVDDQTPQFSFVTILGIAKIVRQKYNELLKWNTRIAERYMGKSNAKAYGERNSTEGVILVRVKPTKVIAEKDIAEWE
jgi:PPOX class probable F420-dependent enzyme